MRVREIHKHEGLNASHFNGFRQGEQELPVKPLRANPPVQPHRTLRVVVDNVPKHQEPQAFQPQLTQDAGDLSMSPSTVSNCPKDMLAFNKIVGRDATLLSILEKIERVASTDATVLILGESGTGKELVASAIHECSARRDSPAGACELCLGAQ